MIHLDALPGTPSYKGSVSSIKKKAIEEADIFFSEGINTVLIENMHDTPYLNRETGHEVSALMAVILNDIVNKFPLTAGIQILAGANKAALAAAHAAGASFIRAEGFVFSHIADEGLFNSDAGELLRYRKMIGAENILIFTDIKKKHSSHTITADVSILETAKAAEFFRSDGIIITGSSTGNAPALKELKALRGKISIPVIAGSGITSKNFTQFSPFIDAAIIGSDFKLEGKWFNAVDKNRVKKFLKIPGL